MELKSGDFEEQSFIARREKEQRQIESLLLGPSDAHHSDLFPDDLVEPVTQLLEGLATSKQYYECLQEKMEGGDLNKYKDLVKEGKIVLYSQSEEENHIIQYMPIWNNSSDKPDIVESIIVNFPNLNFSDSVIKIAKHPQLENKFICPICSFGEKGKNMHTIISHFDEAHREQIQDVNSNWRVFKNTPFNERLVSFAEPINGDEKFKFIPIFHSNPVPDNNWFFLPKMTNKPPWYSKIAKKIGFSKIVKICLFAIIEKSTKEEWNARAVDACQVAGIAIRKHLPEYNIENISLSFDPENSDRAPEKCAWNIFHILRLARIVTFDKPRYEKSGGGKTKPTIGLCFITNDWDSDIHDKMSEIRERYSRFGSKPMLCPPTNHISKKLPGGPLQDRLRRLFLRKQKSKWANPGEENEAPIKALNTLQKTSWCINQRVLQFAIKYIGSYEDINGKKHFNYSNKFIELTHRNPDERDIPWHDRAALDWANELNSREDGSRFWHAWCFDWRGRMYSASNVLSPQGNDLSRALIQFHDYMPVPGFDKDPKTGDPTALYWLKVNLVEMFNGQKLQNGEKANKRLSFDDRVSWVNKNKKTLLEIAANPEEYEEIWWDEICKGINAGATTFRRLASLFDFEEVCKDIEISGEGKSRLPVQQDASSNWLQHTAMILKDENLAKLSNIVELEKSDKPNDIYTKVTQELQKFWQSKQGGEHPFIDIFLHPSVNKKLRRRNVAKKPIMAVAYGGDPKSAAKEFMSNSGPTEFDVEIGQHIGLKGLIYDISNVVGGVLDESEHQQFVNQLMDDYKTALHNVAEGHDGVKIKTQSIQKRKPPNKHKTPTNSALTWTTPAGFTIMNQKGTTVIEKLESWKPIHKKFWNRKTTIYPLDINKFNLAQSLRGAPPNFIHSIDASHMQMAIMDFSKQLQINDPQSLSMVHDSFGCHAANINKLRRSVLDTFIEVHNHQPLQMLENSNIVTKEIIEKGTKVNIRYSDGDVLPGTIARTTESGDKEAYVLLDNLPIEIPSPIINIEFLNQPKESNNFAKKIGLKNAFYIIG